MYHRPVDEIRAKNRRLINALALVALAVALGVRLLWLTSQEIWYDEAALLTWASMGPEEWSAHLRAGGVPVLGLFKAPLVFAALKAWLALVGNSELALRLPFAIIGGATVAPLYLLVTRLVSRPAALGAAALLALHPLHIYYSQQVSEYGPLVLAAVCSMLLWTWLREQERTHLPAAAGLVALNTAALLIHPMGGTLALIQAIMDAPRRRRGLWLNLLPLAAWAGLLAATGADAALLQASLSWIPPLSLDTALDTARQVTAGVMVHGGLAHEQLPLSQAAMLMLMPFLAVYGLVALARSEGQTRRWTAAFLVVWLVLPAALLAAWSLLVRNQWVPRYLLLALPASLILVGAAFGALWKRQRPAAGLAGLMALAISSMCAWQQLGQGGDGMREVALELARDVRRGDGVIVSPDRLALPLGYYHGNSRAWLERTLRLQRRFTAADRWLFTDFDAPRRHLHLDPGFAAWLAGRRRVFVVTVQDWAGDAHTAGLLAHLRKKRSQRYKRFFPYGSVHILRFDEAPAKKDE